MTTLWQINNSTGVDKILVWLWNVDNTTDLLKPISTATQTALNNKANLSLWNDFTWQQTINW